MVTYMIFWMRKHARGLKHELEGSACDALAAGLSDGAVAMAFLAVIREGLETAVFLLAAFDASSASGRRRRCVARIAGGGHARVRASTAAACRINLSRFFRVTGIVLVLVAAGLRCIAMHTAHEAGWFNSSRARRWTSSGSSRRARSARRC